MAFSRTGRNWNFNLFGRIVSIHLEIKPKKKGVKGTGSGRDYIPIYDNLEERRQVQLDNLAYGRQMRMLDLEAKKV